LEKWYNLAMISRLKQALYFPVAGYFQFWANFRLRRWRPQIVVVTGSSGKTTLLHLLEAQIGAKAHYSHKANSAFGISFDVLGLKPTNSTKLEWIWLALLAPLKVLAKLPEQRLYVAEADSDRPGEAKFIAKFLRPDVTIWLSCDKSHSANFDKQAASSVEEAIAGEFGNYLRYTKNLVIVNAAQPLIMKQTEQIKANLKPISPQDVTGWKVSATGVSFTAHKTSYQLPVLAPHETALSVLAVAEVCAHFNISLDPSFKNLVLPPGRSSVLAGIKQTTIIDSSYNSVPDAARAMLQLFGSYPATDKWLVLGDMIEQGKSEAAEHEALATEIAALKLQKVVLMGPRVSKYTAPKLKQLGYSNVICFTEPKPALDYLTTELNGGETIMFKGARFLEGIIEHLLADPADASKLCRRELVWQRWREKWGL